MKQISPFPLASNTNPNAQVMTLKYIPIVLQFKSVYADLKLSEYNADKRNFEPINKNTIMGNDIINII